MHYFVGGVVGFAVGVFCPSLARAVHFLFSKEVKMGGVKLADVAQDVKKKL